MYNTESERLAFLQRLLTNRPDHAGEEAFFGFYHANPEIVSAFLDAAERMSKHKRRYGAQAIIQNIRWEHDISGKDGQFKISSHQAAYLARFAIAMGVVPEGFFLLKELTSVTREKRTKRLIRAHPELVG